MCISFAAQELDRKLYELKEVAPGALLLPNKPVPGLSCRHCAPTNSVSTGFLEFNQTRTLTHVRRAAVLIVNWVNSIEPPPPVNAVH